MSADGPPQGADGAPSGAVGAHTSAAGPSEGAEARFNQAATLHQQGKLAEAVDAYRAALALRPDLVVGHYNLGSALKALGELDEAAASYRKAIALQPDFHAAHYNLANTLRDLRRGDDAIASYRKAIALKPDFAEAYNNLGLVYQAQGRFDQAAENYRKAIAIQPGFADPHNNLGSALDALGLAEVAVASYRRALELDETPEYKANFVRCIRQRTFTRADPALKRLVARALAEPWAAPSELAKAAVSLIRTDPAIDKVIDRAARAWPRLLPAAELFGGAGPAPLASDPLLQALLENTPIADVALERCLTMVRAALLEVASATSESAISPELLTFDCALARQCFINEYVFACSGEELMCAMALREKLVATLQSAGTIAPLWIVAVAAYVPLHSLPKAETLLQRSLGEPLAGLIAQQIAEPLEEARYRDALPRLTPIDEGVSSAVQQQYEESPYPRWLRLPPAGRTAALGDYLRERFPFAPAHPLAERSAIDLLVAGCGTGRESIGAAQQFPDARVLAVDLSLASLGYAKRKTRELGLANVEYAQADLMNLGAIGRTFDAIVSVGVLHHLADPVAGLQALLPLLRPGGVMHVGLYSERARAAVVAARAFIKEHGYAADAEGIRRCRQALIEQASPLIASPDFHATSECRDLLFHVQEHRFTLPQIDAMLRDAGLVLIGFSVGAEALRSYAKRFPDDPAQTDFSHWDAFEREFPDTFAGMYKFWAVKAPHPNPLPARGERE